MILILDVRVWSHVVSAWWWINRLIYSRAVFFIRSISKHYIITSCTIEQFFKFYTPMFLQVTWHLVATRSPRKYAFMGLWNGGMMYMFTVGSMGQWAAAGNNFSGLSEPLVSQWKTRTSPKRDQKCISFVVERTLQRSEIFALVIPARPVKFVRD